MCIGVPAKILEINGFMARCKSRYGEHDVNTILIDEVKKGDWIVVFMESAREKITEEYARTLNLALDAVEKAGNEDEDNNWQKAFADIIARETGEISRLPPHLQHYEKKN